MRNSRRGRIIDLLSKGYSHEKVLQILDSEFRPGTLLTSNKQALSGTLCDLGRINKKVRTSGSLFEKKVRNRSNLTIVYSQDQLAAKLREFNAEPVIDHYRKKYLFGKSPASVLFSSVDNTIYRAFRYENPSQRYRNWRWHKTPGKMLEILNGLRNQNQYDDFAYQVGRSLVMDWGKTNDRGEPTRMNIGVAMKITNLVLKHLSFSSHSSNPSLIGWLHVPWDSYTLRPLRKIWQFEPPIPSSPTQGFVNNFNIYQRLHRLISEIADAGGTPRIY